MPPRFAGAVLFATVAAGFALLPCEPDAGVRGTVVSAGRPVPGAIVRWQGRTTSAVADARGRFHVRASGGVQRLTAAKEGFLVAWTSSRRPHLSLEVLPTDDHEDYAWISPIPDPHAPNNCGNCHEAIFDEWSQSAHASSARNPKFLHLFAGTDGVAPPAKTWNLLEEHPLGSGVCAKCHAPTLEAPDLGYDVRQARGTAAHGVHCDYCHKIADAPTDKLGVRFGRDGYPLVRPAPGRLLVFGSLGDAVRPGEDFAYAPFYRDSRYCASCHEGVIFGVHVYGTYSEWLESPARREGKQCQDCHMTPTGRLGNLAPGHGGIERDPAQLASHVMPGATVEMLRRCLKLNVVTARRGGQVEVRVELRAVDVGHRVPTGFIDRHLVLVVAARTAAGDAPLLAGPTLPKRVGPEHASSPGRIFGKQHVNDDGAPLPFWRLADAEEDTRLIPGRPETATFVFGGDVRELHVRLLYRRFWDEVARARGWSDNELVVVNVRVPAIEE
jgi:hypothetical protein